MEVKYEGLGQEADIAQTTVLYLSVKDRRFRELKVMRSTS